MSYDGKALKPGSTTLAPRVDTSSRQGEPGKRTLTEAVSPQTVADASPAPAVQMRSGDARRYVPYQVTVDHSMTQDEFKTAAMTQVFGGPLTGLVWQNLRDQYTPDQSPYVLQVEVSLFKQLRGNVTPVSASTRPIPEQAFNIAKKIKRYDPDVAVIVDLKNLAPDKATSSPNSRKTAL